MSTDEPSGEHAGPGEGGAGGAADASARSYSVSQLNAEVRRLVHAAFPAEVWVEGDIGSISRTRNGHVFFQLVEHGLAGGTPLGRLHVVLWDDVRQEVNEVLRASGAVRMTEGVRLRIRGWLDVFPRSGQVQLRMTGIDPTHTVGHMATQRAALLRVLAEEGVLDANRRRPMPALPLRLGLVTSIGSAAHADVVDELAGSGIGFSVRVVDVAVQGEGAPMAVAEAVGLLDRSGVDLIVVARGGGARTDLMAFDAEVVARAIAASTVPVLTGIGHEIDSTVADEVAHSAHKTPTACAAAVVRTVSATIARVDELAAELARTAPAMTARAASRADERADRVARLAASHLRRADADLAHVSSALRRGSHVGITAAERRLDRAAASVAGSAGRRLRHAERDHDAGVLRVLHRAEDPLRRAEARLEVAAARAAALDPQRALARGWSLTRLEDGTLVRGPGSLPVGTVLRTTTAGGVLTSTVSHPGGEPGGQEPAVPTARGEGATTS